MKNQFRHPEVNGFQSTCFKQNIKHFKKIDKDMVQILHRGSIKSGHWFTISTLGCQEGNVNICDSSFRELDQESKVQICSILKQNGKYLKPVQHQIGGSDCGLFAIAFAVALCFGLNPAKLIFNQECTMPYFALQTFSNVPFSVNINRKKKKKSFLIEKT